VSERKITNPYLAGPARPLPRKGPSGAFLT
jgi:hypothetical protein